MEMMMSERGAQVLMGRLCFASAIAFTISLMLQLAVGGVFPFLCVVAACLVGFTSGYGWHVARTRRRSRKIERGGR